MNRIRNAWAVLTGKATVCTHTAAQSSFTYWLNGQPYISTSPDLRIGEPTTMATPFRNLTLS